MGERVIDGTRYRAFTHATDTMPQLLSPLRSHGDRDFVIFEGQRLSYRQFMAEVDAIAAALQCQFGVQCGDRVGIAMRNCPDWMKVFTAAAVLGAVVVPINSWGSTEELEFTIRDCAPKVLAADSTRAALAADIIAERSIPVLLSDVDDGTRPLPAHQAARLGVNPILTAVADYRGRDYEMAVTTADQPALLLYTSGSTGHPKGVIYRHIAIGQAIMNMVFLGALGIELGGSLDLRGGATADSQLVTVPLFHATGLFSGFLLPAILGQKIVLMRKWSAAQALKLIAREQVTMLSTVPAIIKDLLTHPCFDATNVSTLTRVSAGGAAMPADLPELLENRLGVVSRSAGYGMTETAAMCAAMSGPIFDLAPLACGVPSPIIDVRICEAAAESRAGDGEGEVQLRGITVTPGYWNRPDITNQAFTDDGWLRTGDLGRIDDDGFLHITGRIKELVIRGGENISPIEIEKVAYRHPGVKEVAVFGVHDDALGEELGMVCHPFPDVALTEKDLRRHLEGLLPAFKVPRYIEMSSVPLPRNASEKIHRLALRNSFSLRLNGSVDGDRPG